LSDLSEIASRLYAAEERGEQQNRKDQLAALELATLFGAENVKRFLAISGYPFAKKLSEDVMKYVREKHMFDLSDRIVPGIQKRLDTYGINHLSAFGDTTLISAVRCLLPGLCRDLLEQGADPEIPSSTGITPLRALILLLVTVRRLTTKETESAGSVFKLIAPSAMSIKIGSQLVKIDRTKAEYLLLELCMVKTILHSEHMFTFLHVGSSLTAADLSEAVISLPDGIVPRYRKEAKYISAVLSKNEIQSKSPYSRRLFYRVRRGHYIINPALDFKIKDEWVPWFEAMQLERLLSTAWLAKPGVANAAIKWLQDAREATRGSKAFGAAQVEEE
jgi:hypothetical protein